MPTPLEDDGSEDVNDFLKRIRELGDQRDREDEERNRKLEEDIIQGRKERQARREERARSLSPTKESSSNAGTPASVRSRHDQSTIEKLPYAPPLEPTRPRGAEMADAPQKPQTKVSSSDLLETSKQSRGLPDVSQRPQALSQKSPSPPGTLSRNGTLSWQQRPSSREFVRSSTQLTASSNPPLRASQRSTIDKGSDGGDERSQIAQSLASKDPAWFRQTQERGLGNAAFRRNQVDSRPVMGQDSAIGLPGMSRDGRPESRAGPSIQGLRSPSPATVSSHNEDSEAASTSASSDPLMRGSNGTSVTGQKRDPPFRTKLATTGADSADTLGHAMSPSQERLQSERRDRSTSPTKGLGGFVQSAMMKRTDSVNKRWSAQAASGLSRGNSIASGRSGFDGPRFQPGGFAPLGEPKPARFSRENTPASTSSRPSSSHSNTTITLHQYERGQEEPSIPISPDEHISTEYGTTSTSPPSELHARPNSKDSKAESVISPPPSPSKRWSPQKSSWLENAISKPDSPKVLSPSPAPQQPSWMANIAKAKEQRGSVDLSKNVPHKQISTGGLMRSPPLGSGYKPPNIGGLPAGFAGGTTGPRLSKSEDGGKLSESSRVPPQDAVTFSSSQKSLSPAHVGSPNRDHFSKSSPSHKDEASSNTVVARDASSSGVISETPRLKPKPETPPKKISQLPAKSKLPPGENNAQEIPEFRNVFGKLKPTQTERYKAPDELKDNIMRGKAGLSVTGGPKKTEHKDDFKESILRKKQGMVTPSASTRITSATAKEKIVAAPEAIQKRQGLSRSESVETEAKLQAPKATEQKQPEALATLSQIRSRSKSGTSAEPIADLLSEQKQANNHTGGNFATSLAGILQRGAPKSSIGASTAVSETEIQAHVAPEARGKQGDADQVGPQLTHATKSRARGPKRKPPSGGQQSAVTQETRPKRVTDTSKPSPAISPVSDEAGRSMASPAPKAKSNPRPLSNITNSNNNNRKPSQPAPRKPSTSVMLSPASSPVVSKPSIPPSSSHTGNLAEAPPKSSPTPKDKPEPKVRVGKPPEPAAAKTESSTPLKTPPVTASKPDFTKVIDLLGQLRQPSDTPAASKSDGKDSVLHLFSEIFDEQIPGKANVKVDTQAILDRRTSKENLPKIKTLRKQITEVLDNGKTIPVPPQQEHVLFEDSLYLCSHIFGTADGQRMTEVYLWCGSGVSPSSVEDAQVFAKRFAKENNGRLVVLAQGKETPIFFQALGGIVITRWGTSRRIDAAAESAYMLCGRQHMGQVAFDEVELAPHSLCSGFPFIISTSAGKLYLWKGRGASADEIGCARLIAMDLGSTGEITEVAEDEETDAFWSIFGARHDRANLPKSAAKYWHLKSARESYFTRLFEVNIGSPRPKSASSFLQWGRRPSTPSGDTNSSLAHVSEISPYSQLDVRDDNIVVVDAYFEVFVIHLLQTLTPPPHRRTSNLSSFRAALLFAQEYAILAASAEDRPSVPQASVVFLTRDDSARGTEIPELLRWSFRRWDTARLKSCRVVGLAEALEAAGMSRSA